MATRKTTRTAAKKATKKKAAKTTGAKKKTTTRKSTARKGSTRKKASGTRASDAPAHPTGISVSREIGGRTLTLETGKMAKLADGAVIARYGDTMVLASAQSASARPDIDFFPLTVDYREKYAAAGRFPGGFFKREARPTTREILTCRIIDRSIRPLFPDDYKAEVQVLSQVLASDKENDADIVAAIASFAALAVSSIPHERVLGAVRVGLKDGEFVLNPTWSALQSGESDLNLTVAAHDSAIVMVEAGANEVEEETIIEALEVAHEACREVIELIDDLVDQAGKEKQEFEPPARDDKLFAAIDKKFGKDLAGVPFAGGTKHERGAHKKALIEEVVEAFPADEDLDDAAIAKHTKTVKEFCYEIIKQGERDGILDGERSDGRDWRTIRPITIEAGLLPRVHGSSLFTRGETQSLSIATLGTADDKQIIDGIYPEERKRFLLHYNFPPFCVGEVRRVGAVGRREIGHGALAERAIEAMLPPESEFPYAVRLTSEILESNGSSSMATVCAGTLALMDAGVPMKQPVAGIAMGLVVEGKRTAILSDILGSEDHCGDMDFKVAGTGRGITALQMDIKCEGLAREVLEEALEQAREGRLHILREMLSVLKQPRSEISENAPRLVSLQIPVDKIGALIGPGGRNVREMQESYEVRISINNDGTVQVAGADAAKVGECEQRIRDFTAEVELNQTYKGRVTAIKEFGCFVEILPGQEGLVHVSELSNEFIRSVTDEVRVGDEIEVKVIEIDDFGKIKLSRKALMGPAEGDGGEERAREERPRGRSRRDEEGERPRGRGPRDGEEDRPRGRGSRDGEEDRPRGRGARDGEEDRPRGRGRDGEEDRPRGRGRRGEEDDRPRGRGARDGEEDRPRSRGPRDGEEDRPRSRGPRDGEEDRPRGRGRRGEEEDRPRGRGARDGEEDRPRGRGARDDEEDRPRGRGRRDEEDRPRGRGPRDDEEDRPRGRGRRDEEDRPRGRGPRDEEDERPRRRPRRDEGDDDAPRGRGSAARDAAGDDERPGGRRPSARDGDEERPRAARRRPAPREGAEDDAPQGRGRAFDERDFEERPRGRSVREVDDEAEERPRSRRRGRDGDDGDGRPEGRGRRGRRNDEDETGPANGGDSGSFEISEELEEPEFLDAPRGRGGRGRRPRR